MKASKLEEATDMSYVFLLWSKNPQLRVENLAILLFGYLLLDNAPQPCPIKINAGNDGFQRKQFKIVQLKASTSMYG